MARALTKRELSEEILFGPRRPSFRDAMYRQSYTGGNTSLIRLPEVAAPHLVQILLLIFCSLALIGYGMDVAVSKDVIRLQEQARRLSEQNSELSAQLLKAISFQGIQESSLGAVGLRVPEQVMIVKEVAPVKVPPFKSTRHFLPLMSGY